MMTAKVTGLSADGGGGVTIKLLGRSGAGIEVPVAAGNVRTRTSITIGGVVYTERALIVGDVVAAAELTAEPGSWLVLARLG